MAYLVKRVETPQTIYILGEYFDVPGTGFGITDDYSSCYVSNGIDERWLDTVGWVEVFTEEELVAAIPKIDPDGYDPEEEWNQDVLVLENFSGDIVLKLIAETACPEHDIEVGDDILEGYDPHDYNKHHCLYTYKDELHRKDGSGACKVERDMRLDLPHGTFMPKTMSTQDVVEPLKQKYNIES